jgi:hypothetical protein
MSQVTDAIKFTTRIMVPKPVLSRMLRCKMCRVLFLPANIAVTFPHDLPSASGIHHGLFIVQKYRKRGAVSL